MASTENMLAQPFRLHCQVRHSKTMRFRSKGEHEADHRLHADLLDHIHAEPQDLPADDEPEGE